MTTPKTKRDPAGTGGWTLLGLALVLGAGGLFLGRVAGVPRLPGAPPDWVELWLTLQGSDVPLEGALAILAGLAWVLWLWLSASVLLRLLVAVAGARAHGAAWAEGLRAFSDRVTLPVVRRVVDGAVVAGVVVQLAGRVPTVGAAGLDGPGIASEAAIAYADPAAGPRAAPAGPAAPDASGQALTVYRVRPGDSLWAIALRFYGDGEGYPRIIEANVGRVMADGRPFTRSGVIQPGWELRVPLPERALASGTTEVTTYVVQPGDSLSGIAGRLWGRPEAWVDLFALNQGTARLADGRVLTRPELIWPGLPLAVPLAPGTRTPGTPGAGPLRPHRHRRPRGEPGGAGRVPPGYAPLGRAQPGRAQPGRAPPGRAPPGCGGRGGSSGAARKGRGPRRSPRESRPRPAAQAAPERRARCPRRSPVAQLVRLGPGARSAQHGRHVRLAEAGPRGQQSVRGGHAGAADSSPRDWRRKAPPGAGRRPRLAQA